MLKKSGIYKITNLANGKFYIGSASNLHKRKVSHFNALNGNYHKNVKLTRGFKKYGKDNFLFEVLIFCPTEYLIKLEQWFIDNMKPWYNISKIAGSSIGIKRTKKQIEAMSKIRKGVPLINRRRYDYDLIKLLHLEGKNTGEIGRIVGATKNTIYDILKKIEEFDTSFKFKRTGNSLINRKYSWDEIINLKKEGKKWKEILKITGISSGGLYKISKKHKDIFKKQPLIHIKFKKEIQDLLKSGKTVNEISKILGISPPSIRDCIKKYKNGL